MLGTPAAVARLQVAMDLGEGRHRVGKVLHDSVDEDGVKGVIGEGEASDVTFFEAKIAHVALRGELPRPGNGVGINVDAYDLALAEDGGEIGRDRTRAAAAIEQAHPGSQMGEEEGGVRGRPPLGEESYRVGGVLDLR